MSRRVYWRMDHRRVSPVGLYHTNVEYPNAFNSSSCPRHALPYSIRTRVYGWPPCHQRNMSQDREPIRNFSKSIREIWKRHFSTSENVVNVLGRISKMVIFKFALFLYESFCRPKISSFSVQKQSPKWSFSTTPCWSRVMPVGSVKTMSCCKF